MARKVSQSDPALAIEFWLSGFYTHRSQLFAPFKGIGVNVVSFHDPVIDGANMEDTDLYEWTRRPGFSLYCTEQLAATEVVNQFYSMRNFAGNVIPFVDSTLRFASFNTSSITSLIEKTTTNEGFATSLGNMLYFSDGIGIDAQKWNSVFALSTINPSSWGIPAPTVAPNIFAQGCWLPFTSFAVNNAILDPNGNVEVVTTASGGIGQTGSQEPIWPTTTSSAINDGTLTWTNMGPILTWLPDTYYPVPVVVLDTNGNLELATAVSPATPAWNAGTTYAVGNVVFFGGAFWVAVAASTGVAPTSGYTVATTTGGTTTTQPYWSQTLSPSTTGVYPSSPYVPSWNTVVGGTTDDNNYIWTNLGPGILVESFGTSYVYAYRTIYGHLSTASPVSSNTGSIFGPQVSTINSFSITSGVVTFFGVNNFILGSQFTVENLTSTVGVSMNHLPFIVQSVTQGMTPSFSAELPTTFSPQNWPLTPDEGTTANLIASLVGNASSSSLCNAVVNITASSSTAGVVTLYAVNNFAPGIFVTITGATVASFLNNQQFQIISVDPLGTWFQVFYVTDQGAFPSDYALTTDSGMATFNSVEIYRLSDGGGIYLFAGAVTNPVQGGSGGSGSYDSGFLTAGLGITTSGSHMWTNPNNVTSATQFATVSVPAPVGTPSSGFRPIQSTQVWKCVHTIPGRPRNGTVQASLPNVTAGNAILIYALSHQPIIDNTFQDSQGNSYTLLEQNTHTYPDGSQFSQFVLIAINVSGGTTNISMAYDHTSPDNAFFAFIATECQGVTATTDGITATTTPGGTSSFNTGTITTANASDVVLSFMFDNLPTSGQTVTPPGGYTVFSSQVFEEPTGAGSNFGGNFLQMASCWQQQSATGTFSPTWNLPTVTRTYPFTMGITVALQLNVFEVSTDLNATDFGFAVPPTLGVTGIEVSFNASFNGTVPDGVIIVQLLKGGAPVGTPIQVALRDSTSYNVTLGGPGILWGFPWTASDFNNAAWGVQFTATTLAGGTTATFGVSDVQARVFAGTSTTWIFNDFATDEELNALLIAPQSHQNDPPPGCPGSSIQPAGTITAYWNGRIWMAVGNYLYFDAGPDCTNGIPEESWPPANRFQFVGPIYNLIPTPDNAGLLVYLADRVNAILGGPETISFYPTDVLNNFGISTPNAVFKDGTTIGQFTTQKQYFDLSGPNKQEIGEHIADYLTENFAATSVFATMHRNGLDVGTFLSNGVDRIVRFGNNISAWSVPAFPANGAGALRSIETTVGEYSLMLASPTAGQSSATAAINPASGASIGSGIAWTNPNNITVGSPTSYATLTGTGTSQILAASKYPLHIPSNAVVTGVRVAVTGKQTGVTGGIGAFDKQVIATGTGQVNIGPLTPAAPNEFAFFIGQFVENTDLPFYILGGGGSAIDSYTVLNGTITVNGSNNLQPGQVVLCTGVNGGGTLDGVTLTVVTASPTSWTAFTSLANQNHAGTSGLASAAGWVNLTKAAGSYYNSEFFGMWGAPIGANTNPFPSTEPFGWFNTNPATNGWNGALALFQTDGSLPAVANGNAAAVGSATSTHAAFAGVTAGNTLVVWASNFNTSDPGQPTITDTQGNVYTILPNNDWFPGYSTYHNRNILAIANVQSTAACTVTVTWSTSVTWSGTVLEMSGLLGVPLTITPLNSVSGAEIGHFNLGASNTTVTFGGPTDLWGMPWESPVAVNANAFGFGISASTAVTNNVSISEVKVTVFYNVGGYLLARDVNSWGDNGVFGENNGSPYDSCFITVGSVTLSQPGAQMFPLQHIVGYFDAVGTLNEGAPSQPDIWILPNEVNDTAGIGFLYLPEVLPEPPQGQNSPSQTMLALRWPVNMMNSQLASQYIHHLQVKIQFEPENAPNTIKALAFKENQE